MEAARAMSGTLEVGVAIMHIARTNSGIGRSVSMPASSSFSFGSSSPNDNDDDVISKLSRISDLSHENDAKRDRKVHRIQNDFPNNNIMRRCLLRLPLRSLRSTNTAKQ